MNERPHLLLAVTADGQALSLVDCACRLARSGGASWSVVALDSAAREAPAPELRGPLLQALDRAQQLGATVTHIITGSPTSGAQVSALVNRALSEGATMVMVGQQAHGPPLWPLPSRSAGALAQALSRRLPGVTLHIVCPPGQGTAAATARRRRVMEWKVPRGASSALLALVAATGVGAVLERHLDPANIVMIYLAGVVYVASRAGKAPAIATVLGSIFLYDLIFVHPRWSLKPTEPQYWMAFLVMMVVGLIISQLAARSREQALLAEARAQRSQALNQLSVTLGRARDPQAIAQALCAAVDSATGVRADLLLAAAGGGLQPGQRLPDGFDPALARRALDSGFEIGAVPGGGQRLRYVPLIAGESAVGLLVFEAPVAERDSLEDRHLVRALANQAAIALERADLERRSIAAAVEAEGERTRNTLLAGISHDFRTPLTTIVGSATMLLEQASAIGDADRTSLLQKLLDEAQRLHVLSSNLLDLTRLDKGAIQLRPEWCPADELLEAALDQLRPRLSRHELHVAVPADALVWCDARLIDQVLVNLLDNAVRHARPAGTIHLAVEVTPAEWLLIVHDDGPGIPAGHERAIFTKFYRATDDSESTGKGLGLAICAAIAALHGGGICAENASGARFTMRLPQPALPDLDQADLA